MQVVPVVDGNVVRVIARLKTISRNPKDTETIKKIWSGFLLLCTIQCQNDISFELHLPQDSNYILGHFSHLSLCIHLSCVECKYIKLNEHFDCSNLFLIPNI